MLDFKVSMHQVQVIHSSIIPTSRFFVGHGSNERSLKNRDALADCVPEACMSDVGGREGFLCAL
jgi:hypothetical protein